MVAQRSRRSEEEGVKGRGAFLHLHPPQLVQKRLQNGVRDRGCLQTSRPAAAASSPPPFLLANEHRKLTVRPERLGSGRRLCSFQSRPHLPWTRVEGGGGFILIPETNWPSFNSTAGESLDGGEAGKSWEGGGGWRTR